MFRGRQRNEEGSVRRSRPRDLAHDAAPDRPHQPRNDNEEMPASKKGRRFGANLTWPNRKLGCQRTGSSETSVLQVYHVECVHTFPAIYLLMSSAAVTTIVTGMKNETRKSKALAP